MFQTHSLHIQSNPHSHSVAIVLCCAVGATTKDPYCVCISQQRPPRKCMDYVFERGRVQKQLPGPVLSPSQPSPPGGECRVHKRGKMTALEGKRRNKVWGCFWTGNYLCLLFWFFLGFFSDNVFPSSCLADLRQIFNWGFSSI